MTENQIEKIEKKPESIGSRLKELIDFYRLNMNSLSTRLKLPSNSIITRIVKDPKRGMSLDLIQKILSEFRDIDAGWFVMGRGEMLIEKQTEAINPNNYFTTIMKQKDDMIGILKQNNQDLRDANSELKKRIEGISNRVEILQDIAGLPKKEIS